MANRNLGSQRREYVAEPLRKKDLAAHPVDQFAKWYKDAEDNLPGYPNPMILSTNDESGQPYSRVVLLKSFNDQGFVFYTNYGSSKGRQIANNSKVALLFFWEALERQVCIRGMAEKYDTVAADEYFASRPRGSQLSALASSQSSVIESRETLEAKYKSLDAQLQGLPVPRPENWGGYLVRAHEIEFWQGQPDRLHDRLVYKQCADESGPCWEISRLSP